MLANILKHKLWLILGWKEIILVFWIFQEKIVTIFIFSQRAAAKFNNAHKMFPNPSKVCELSHLHTEQRCLGACYMCGFDNVPSG